MLSPDSDADRVALHRYAVIAEALPERLSRAERGAVVRVIAMRTHGHPDGSERRYSRGTVDRWTRDYKRSGLVGLTPQTRSDVGKVRAHPELSDVVAALRIELPTRSSVQIADMRGIDSMSELLPERCVSSYAGRGCIVARYLLIRKCSVGSRLKHRINGGSPMCLLALMFPTQKLISQLGLDCS